MKYLLLVAIALVVLWVWRQQGMRRQERRSPAPGPARATEIVACTHCQLHLPRTQALAGQRGMYCCEAHRQEAEGG